LGRTRSRCGPEASPEANPTANQSNPFSLFSYDNFGNLAHRDRKAAGQTATHLDFEWDTDGRLCHVRNPTAPIFSATYAADGERVSKLDGETGRRFHFGLVDEDMSSNQDSVTHTPGYALRQNGLDRVTHSDWLGSTRYLTDATGTALPTYAKRFDAYGLQTAFAGTDGPGAVANQYAGVWGYHRDAAEIGLDHLHHRYYDPAIGRFITRDPIRWSGASTSTATHKTIP